jgi:hypothetical protein
VDGYWIKGPEGGAVVEVKDVQLLDGAAKLFKKELKPLLLLLLKALLFVFAMAAFASALAVREDGLKAPPASAEVSALLAGRGDAVGMMGVMWAVALAPARLLKL